MKIDIHVATNGILEQRGYIILNSFDHEECLILCNWFERGEYKPKNLHSDIAFCDYGVCFTNPKTHQIWMTLSYDWLVGDEDEIIKYIKAHKDKKIWI